MNQQYTFKPMSKEELRPLLGPGEYKFQVYSAEMKMSKANNPQIVLNVKATSPTGMQVFITDYLLLPNPQVDDEEKIRNKTWKLRNFCYSVGLEKEYEAGNFNAICANAIVNGGKRGTAKVVIERGNEYRGNDGQLKMGYDKNRITSYIETEGQSQLASLGTATTGQESVKYNSVPSYASEPIPFADDIPF